MKCPNCKHSLAILENKHLNFYYIGCKKCSFAVSKNYYPNGEWFAKKSDASTYKKNISNGRKSTLVLGEK